MRLVLVGSSLSSLFLHQVGSEVRRACTGDLRPQNMRPAPRSNALTVKKETLNTSLKMNPYHQIYISKFTNSQSFDKLLLGFC